ncbi:hypothetical protein EON62_06580, partial [archaeon]
YNAWAESGYDTAFCQENFIQYKSMCRARSVRGQLEALCERVEIAAGEEPGTTSFSEADAVSIGKCITAGFFYNAAQLARGAYETLKTRRPVAIHPSSCLAPKNRGGATGPDGKPIAPRDEDGGPSNIMPPRWVCYYELVETSKEYMRTVIEIQPAWLVEIAPHYYKAKDVQPAAKGAA